MILIADSGSTKCDWILLENEDKSIVTRIRTKGVNPSVLKKKNIDAILNACEEMLQYKDAISSIYFFGAGCNNKKGEQKIEKAFQGFFPNIASMVIQEDLMLAVFAASKDPSVVCILGTGSNCCYYNGNSVEQRVKAMGYILMDEGSGNHLGKEVLKSYYYRELPEDLKFSLEKEFNLHDDKVLGKLYGSKLPNRYLAKYARFLFENIEHPFAKKIITSCISEFIDRQLLQYKNELHSVPLYFIGSVGYHARDIIKSELAKRGLQAPENFIRRPLTAFIETLKADVAFLDTVV